MLLMNAIRMHVIAQFFCSHFMSQIFCQNPKFLTKNSKTDRYFSNFVAPADPKTLIKHASWSYFLLRRPGRMPGTKNKKIFRMFHYFFKNFHFFLSYFRSCHLHLRSSLTPAGSFTALSTVFSQMVWCRVTRPSAAAMTPSTLSSRRLAPLSTVCSRS